LKTDWKRTCFSGFPPVLAPELHSGVIMQGRIIASNACLSAPEAVKRGERLGWASVNQRNVAVISMAVVTPRRGAVLPIHLLTKQIGWSVMQSNFLAS
jgi:hypothetical protein